MPLPKKGCKKIFNKTLVTRLIYVQIVSVEKYASVIELSSPSDDCEYGSTGCELEQKVIFLHVIALNRKFSSSRDVMHHFSTACQRATDLFPRKLRNCAVYASNFHDGLRWSVRMN